MIKRTTLLLLMFCLSLTSIVLAKPDDEEPIIIAHRGANNRFNEHTLTAYKLASKDGVDYLEIDLRMTKDHELIAMHDATLDRTTDGKGKVSDYTLNEIKSFKTIGTFHNKTVSEEIPSLKEILKTFAKNENFYIETRKVNNQLVMEEPLVKLLRKYDVLKTKRVVLQSFSKESLEKLWALAPTIPLTLLYRKGEFDLKQAMSTPYPIIGIESSDVTKDVVEELHKAGKKVHVYFTNKQTQIAEQKRIIKYGVDGYFTDFIKETQQLLQK
ncbi:glycerophosphodiester phosphodiesterase [Fredinandcohnia sp. 179-A 10B2 NHS]|uniref:glycerophosphodiester phosphodiesterase n=1 Tax=Fredinandcohnia sp. 179-A 10B2 NHS TaxID=3235176 RepID=UPI0039A3831E